MPHPILELLERIKADAEAVSLDLADLIILATERPQGDEDKVKWTRLAYYNDQGSIKAKKLLASLERAIQREAREMHRIRASAQAIFSGEAPDMTLRGSTIHPDEFKELVARRERRWEDQQSAAGELESTITEYEPHRIEDQPSHPAEKSR